MARERRINIPEPEFSKFLFSGTRFSWAWLLLRVYLGWQWLQAGWEKIMDPAWIGADAGTAIRGFVAGAKVPSAEGWYTAFLNLIGGHPVIFSATVAGGETLIGLALVLGAFTGIAAFCGAFLNFNYLLAGVVSVNPVFIIIELLLILAWRNAGWWGLDRYLLPKLGVPWKT